jgi:hypothetical protein
MIKYFQVCGLVFLFIFLSDPTFAQSFNNYVNYPDMGKAFNNAVHLYDKAISSNSRLYNGEEYTYRFHNIKGHQFLDNEEFVKGNIVYDGLRYDSVELMYDIYQQKVVIKNFRPNGHAVKIGLIYEKIEGFSLGDRNFQYLDPDSLNPDITPGFYNILIDDEIAVAIYRSKYVIKTLGSNRYPEMFATNDHYYIVRDNEFIRIRSKRRILKLFADQKKALKKYCQKNQIFYKKDPEKALILICSEYLRLTS